MSERVPIGGYYDQPLLKPPVWTWEVPLYFFVGGAAGGAAVIGFAAQMTGANPKLVRDARWIAAAGAILSAPLLIADLGRPERFLNMLRVFKPQSPMSVGAWTLAAFGGAATGAAIAPWKPVRNLSAAGAAATGLVLSTYTGVLLGVTAIPVWYEHARVLPVHFGASGLASAASLLQLAGHRDRALHAIATACNATEVVTGFGAPKDLTTRIGGFFSGPLPLALRLLGGRRARKAAAASTLLGSLLTRIAWVEAGKRSASDASRR
jgi:formate-dependent nitrite reductase membrane component NrfD